MEKKLEDIVGPRERNIPKDIGLFFASPFIGLAYVAALPVYGMYKIGETALEAYKSRK